jgi:hypothetical protein
MRRDVTHTTLQGYPTTNIWTKQDESTKRNVLRRSIANLIHQFWHMLHLIVSNHGYWHHDSDCHSHVLTFGQDHFDYHYETIVLDSVMHMSNAIEKRKVTHRKKQQKHCDTHRVNIYAKEKENAKYKNEF